MSRLRLQAAYLSVAALLLLACGRVGYDPLALNGDTLDGGSEPDSDIGPDGLPFFLVEAVSPRWLPLAGGKIEITFAGKTDGVSITVDGAPCVDPIFVEPQRVSCTAPSRATPGVVKLSATNAASQTALRENFAYLTPGSLQFGGAADDRTSGVAVDHEGNVYVTGGTNGDLDGPGAGDFDAVFVKYNAAGVFQWVRQLGTSQYDYSRDVAVGPSGNPTIAGYGAGDIDGSGGTAGGNDIFVARYSPSGDLKWVTQLGSSGDDQAWDLAVDDSDAVAVAARTTGAMTAAGNAGLVDAVIVHLTPDGVVDWTEQFGTAADDNGHSIAMSGEGVVYFVGYTKAVVEPGATNAGGYDMFVARYESDGQRTWIRQRGSGSDDQAQDATVDDSGNVWISGITSAALDGNTAFGSQDIFAMNFSSAGDWILTRQYGSSASENTFGIDVDAKGQVFISCNTTASFGGANVVGGTDVCVISLDSAGNELWTQIIGSSASDLASSCTVDAHNTGLIYVSAITDGNLDGGGARGLQDIAVIKLDTAGAEQ
jgi:hypothetical protein